MQRSLIYEIILDILSDGAVRATEQILAELKAEYPQVCREIQGLWVKENGFNCGAIQYPTTVISQCLEEMAAGGKIKKLAHKLWTAN